MTAPDPATADPAPPVDAQAAPAATGDPAAVPAEPAAAPARPARKGVSPVVWIGLAAVLAAAGVVAWAYMSPVQDSNEPFTVELKDQGQ